MIAPSTDTIGIEVTETIARVASTILNYPSQTFAALSQAPFAGLESRVQQSKVEVRANGTLSSTVNASGGARNNLLRIDRRKTCFS